MTYYDNWRFFNPADDFAEVGTKVGEVCGRGDFEPSPRAWAPVPCDGIMFPDAGWVTCDVCGWTE